MVRWKRGVGDWREGYLHHYTLSPHWSSIYRLLIVIMGQFYSGWEIIYGKVIYTKSMIDAVSRGLLPCIRSAIEVSPSLQSQCILSLIQRAMSEQMQSDLSEPISKKQKTEKDEHANLSTTKTVATILLVENVSDVERSLVDEIITNFIARVAEWTENEKEMHRKRLSRIDVIKKRGDWAADFDDDCSDVDVEDDDFWRLSGWEDEDKDELDIDMTYEAEKMTKEFEAMILQLSRVFVGTLSAKVTYDTNYGYSNGYASILTVDGMQADGSTEMNDLYGSSAFKFKPSFFDVPPGDVQSIKFVSNLLGLDDSATVADLEDEDQSTGRKKWSHKKGAPEKNDDVEEEGTRGNDPAWIIVGCASFG